MAEASSLRLRSPAQPPLALIVRTFVAGASRYLGLGPDLSEDLRLAASELFAAAIESGGTELDLSVDGDDTRLTLTFRGVPDLGGGSEDLPNVRRDLLTTLFPDLHHEDGAVVIRAGSWG